MGVVVLGVGVVVVGGVDGVCRVAGSRLEGSMVHL